MSSPTFLHEPVVLSLNIADIVEGDWQALPDCLSPDERRRADAFLHVADRHSFIAAHALLRLSLSAVLGSSPATWAFVTNAYGKPCFAPDHERADIGFNISHCRGMAVVGIGCDVAIGVDTEPLNRLADGDMAAVMRWLSADEQSRLIAYPADERAARLIDLWTLKEAVIKASGQGLSLPLSSFSIDPDGLSVAGLSGEWRLARWSRDGHRVAAALVGALMPNHNAVVIVRGARGLQVVAK